MTRWWRPLGMRVRLTFWHVAAMIVVLAVYAAGVFAFVSRSVSHALDSRLRGDYTWAAEMWEQRPDGTLTWFEADDAGQDEDKPWLQVWSGDLLFRPPPPSAFRCRKVPRCLRADGQLSVDADGDAVRVLTRGERWAARA